MHSILYESPDIGAIIYKEFESSFSVFLLQSKNPYSNSVYLVRVPLQTFLDARRSQGHL